MFKTVINLLDFDIAVRKQCALYPCVAYMTMMLSK